MTSYGDLLAVTKQQIVEVDTATAAQLIKDNHVVLDVREPEEFDPVSYTHLTLPTICSV